MAARRPLPTRFLLTDERLGGACADDALWEAIRRLPRGAGVVLRHYSWPRAERIRLAHAVAALTRRRGLLLLLTPGLERLRADGWHWPGWARGRPPRGGIVMRPAHDRRALQAAAAAGADLVFLSPVFPTASHPGATAMGPLRFGLACRGAAVPVLALGGMTEQRFGRMAALGAAGYGAVDGWR